MDGDELNATFVAAMNAGRLYELSPPRARGFSDGRDRADRFVLLKTRIVPEIGGLVTMIVPATYRGDWNGHPLASVPGNSHAHALQAIGYELEL